MSLIERARRFLIQQEWLPPEGYGVHLVDNGYYCPKCKVHGLCFEFTGKVDCEKVEKADIKRSANIARVLESSIGTFPSFRSAHSPAFLASRITRLIHPSFLVFAVLWFEVNALAGGDPAMSDRQQLTRCYSLEKRLDLQFRHIVQRAQALRHT